MAKLKLGTIPDDKPVKLTIELPAAIHRDLVGLPRARVRQLPDKLGPTDCAIATITVDGRRWTPESFRG